MNDWMSLFLVDVLVRFIVAIQIVQLDTVENDEHFVVRSLGHKEELLAFECYRKLDSVEKASEVAGLKRIDDAREVLKNQLSKLSDRTKQLFLARKTNEVLDGLIWVTSHCERGVSFRIGEVSQEEMQVSVGVEVEERCALGVGITVVRLTKARILERTVDGSGGKGDEEGRKAEITKKNHILKI
ncbi:hypothetical protein GCK72_025412 [Caenorhabditis remanei]|uniref:Uncharacterized protein n=1 Tax=Caenorhabditis remanei TaxID=31234 RepID=A0A6A5G2N4_CAERE|nr:hypothetical protein GCK72_025412 [Caenorhabditis remanei]KAF1748945.1 hypothetical protein GCK72_025412 [Caenorhabditis remanei]